MGRFDRMNETGKQPPAPVKEPEAVVEPEPIKDSGTKIPPKVPRMVPPKVSAEVPSPVTPDNVEFLDTVRRAIKWPGKEGQNLRITQEEKDNIKAVVRYFEDKSYPTDATQVIRVWIAAGLLDFQQNGDKSMIAKVLERINTY